MAEETDQGSLCYGPGSIAGAVIGTFLITILIFAVVVFLYRQWRKHKGKDIIININYLTKQIIIIKYIMYCSMLCKEKISSCWSGEIFKCTIF